MDWGLKLCNLYRIYLILLIGKFILYYLERKKDIRWVLIICDCRKEVKWFLKIWNYKFNRI